MVTHNFGIDGWYYIAIKMTQTKYFQKLKCESGNGTPDNSNLWVCPYCYKGSGIIAGVNITETITPILYLFNELENRYKHRIYRNPMSKTMQKDILESLQKAKQIIENNVIKVEE